MARDATLRLSDAEQHEVLTALYTQRNQLRKLLAGSSPESAKRGYRTSLYATESAIQKLRRVELVTGALGDPAFGEVG